jgi:hypothetical protein
MECRSSTQYSRSAVAKKPSQLRRAKGLRQADHFGQSEGRTVSCAEVSHRHGARNTVKYTWGKLQ